MGQVRVRYNQNDIENVRKMLEVYRLNTVCSAASCPNMGECFKRKTATFMILGSQCTRNCRFCNIINGIPDRVDKDEPERIAKAVAAMGIKHSVITSVTRDDLPNGGAEQFAAVIKAIRKLSENTTVEVLVPDFKGSREALEIVLEAEPDVLNHNVETVKSLYSEVRPEANYDRSLRLLQRAKEIKPDVITKTGIMVGLGETEQEVLELMDDVRSTGCDLITVGQYMQPTGEHLPVHEYISQEQFDKYREEGQKKGFMYVASGPLVRSSYRAEEALRSER